MGSFDCSFDASFDVDPTCSGGDIFACLSAYDCLTADPFDCCCL